MFITTENSYTRTKEYYDFISDENALYISIFLASVHPVLEFLSLVSVLPSHLCYLCWVT
uniref:Uncharacterized protein n=1 Tax=Arundo donax TaxID=35708 RepID=A0A0A9DWU8_ARUDO